jgi:hypothetical protein
VREQSHSLVDPNTVCERRIHEYLQRRSGSSEGPIGGCEPEPTQGLLECGHRVDFVLLICAEEFPQPVPHIQLRQNFTRGPIYRDPSVYKELFIGWSQTQLMKAFPVDPPHGRFLYGLVLSAHTCGVDPIAQQYRAEVCEWNDLADPAPQFVIFGVQIRFVELKVMTSERVTPNAHTGMNDCGVK